MKTKDLIAALRGCDPTGELHVGVGNSDILFVTTAPAYYDGRQQVLQRSGRPDCYDVTGVEFRSDGTKVVIHSYSVWDAIADDPEVLVTYDSDGTGRLYEDRVEQHRRETREIDAELERGNG